MIQYNIFADHREKSVNAVAQEKKEECNKYLINYEITTLFIGDFLITANQEAVAIFERKTWKDLADSIKDGRILNIQKLRGFRDQTNAMIIYILEGKVPNHKVSHISPFAMKSHLYHLMMRDNVFLLYSKDIEDTFRILIEFVRSMRSLGYVKEPQITQSGGNPQADIELAQNFVPQQPIDIKNKIWRCIKNSKTLLEVLQENFTLLQLINNEPTIEQLSEFRYPSGVSLGIKRAKELLKSASSKDTHIKMITCIPSFSKTIAQQILNDISLNELLNNKESAVEYLQNMLGKKRINTFIHIFYE